MGETFRFEDIQNEEDRKLLRCARCPWCIAELTPVFERGEHVADECPECGDRFEG